MPRKDPAEYSRQEEDWEEPKVTEFQDYRIGMDYESVAQLEYKSPRELHLEENFDEKFGQVREALNSVQSGMSRLGELSIRDRAWDTYRSTYVEKMDDALDRGNKYDYERLAAQMWLDSHRMAYNVAAQDRVDSNNYQSALGQYPAEVPQFHNMSEDPNYHPNLAEQYQTFIEDTKSRFETDPLRNELYRESTEKLVDEALRYLNQFEKTRNKEALMQVYTNARAIYYLTTLDQRDREQGG